MITRFPRWVEYGSFFLSLIAGIINAIGLLAFEHQAISHLSGTVSRIGTGIVNAPFTQVLPMSFIVVSFCLGAAISGFFIRDGSLKLGRNYGGLLILESLLLLGSVFLLKGNPTIGSYTASAACGLQNALVTTYSGAVIRTTHLTGIFTDLGIMLGAKFRGEAFDQRKARLFFVIILGFLLGGTFGAFLFNLYNTYALIVPATMCLLLAFSYTLLKTLIKSYRKHHSPAN